MGRLPPPDDPVMAECRRLALGRSASSSVGFEMESSTLFELYATGGNDGGRRLDKEGTRDG